MQSVGRHLVRNGFSSSEVCLFQKQGRAVSAVRSLGSAAPDKGQDLAKERQAKKEKAMSRKATHSNSFVQNMFRGLITSDQAFPYPRVLDAEQSENLAMLVEPTEKFMTEVNDPLANDTNESVAPETVQVRDDPLDS
jgi:hypothetical protein